MLAAHAQRHGESAHHFAQLWALEFVAENLQIFRLFRPAELLRVCIAPGNRQVEQDDCARYQQSSGTNAVPLDHLITPPSQSMKLCFLCKNAQLSIGFIQMQAVPWFKLRC